jgi:hypothetical protein
MGKKVTIEFDIQDQYDDIHARRALNAEEAYSALSDIKNEIFRPARKHGYADREIEAAFDEEKHGDLIALLEKKFHEILLEHGITSDDI